MNLPTNKTSLSETNQEKGASTGLSTLPLKVEGYSLSKQEFWDLVKIWMAIMSYQICVVAEQNMIFSTVYHARRVALFH